MKRLAPCYQTVVMSVCLSCPLMYMTFVHCGQTAGRMKMILGMQVGLGPGHCIRWRPSYPSPKGAQPLNFRPISVAAKWLHGSRCHLVWS